MPIPIKRDCFGDPFMHTPGDMGVFIDIHEDRDPANGYPIERVLISGTAKFTGQTDDTAAPVLAFDHPPITPSDVPTGWRWPAQLGPDPRYRETAIA